MGVLLGALSALLYGLGDFVGGEASKRAPAPAVVLWAAVASFPLILVAALLMGGAATTADWVFGGAAGVLGAVGLVLLFAGLARGHAAAVAPSAAAVMAVFPVTVALILGERPSALAWSGILLAVPAILLCSWVADSGTIPLGGLGYGLAAGVGFGAYVVLISRTGDASNLLPLIPARAATMVVVLLLAFAGVWGVGQAAALPVGLVVSNGLLDVAGNVTFLLGLRAGPLALVAVVAAMSPAVTVVLAAMVNREHLRKRQTTGLLLALLALTFITVG
jgi:drug/metabolite transporter (DMT)-like permease